VIVTGKYKGGFEGAALIPELVSVNEVVIVFPSDTIVALTVFVIEHVAVLLVVNVQPCR